MAKSEAPTISLAPALCRCSTFAGSDPLDADVNVVPGCGTHGHGDENVLGVSQVAFIRIGQDQDREGVGDGGPVQDDLVGRIAANEEYVFERGVVVALGEIARIHLLADDHNRPLVLDDPRVQFTDQRYGLCIPVTDDDMILEIVVWHSSPAPYTIFN